MLRKVKVEAVVYTVVSGIVGLSAEQAKTRLHNLKPITGKVDERKDSKTRGAGEYEVVNPVQFKRGETFGYSGEVGKTGQLRDPEAEELKRMERAEDLEKAVRAAVSAERERCRQEYAAKLEKEVAARVAELTAKLSAEIEAKVRAELAGQQK